ncbi:MAG: hypothetical protein BroJett011_38290 [Chloroflexota bacterium]|nr:MAG: hypothetical protein BroJett011_38290 [Chloroflexota bacterium]
MRQLLQHPALQNLEPRTPRETLLFIKAHTLGLEAACTAINVVGLENFEVLFDQALPDMWQNVDACADADAQTINSAV